MYCIIVVPTKNVIYPKFLFQFDLLPELLVVLVETKLVKLATEGNYLIKEEDIECNIPDLLKYYNLFTKVEMKKLQPYFDKDGFKQLEAVATHVKLAGGMNR